MFNLLNLYRFLKVLIVVLSTLLLLTIFKNHPLMSFTGDFGADLILETETQRIAVQAKRYKSKVGIKAVQEIASAKSHYRANETWVVTNNFFTAAAVELAQSNGVKLCDRNFLIDYSLKYRESNQTISRVELRKDI